MPLKPSSERERVRSLVLIEARFTQLFHTTKSTLNDSYSKCSSLRLKRQKRKKEEERHDVAKSCEYCRRLHVEEMRFVVFFFFFFWSEKTQQ